MMSYYRHQCDRDNCKWKCTTKQGISWSSNLICWSLLYCNGQVVINRVACGDSSLFKGDHYVTSYRLIKSHRYIMALYYGIQNVMFQCNITRQFHQNQDPPEVLCNQILTGRYINNMIKCNETVCDLPRVVWPFMSISAINLYWSFVNILQNKL